MSDRFKSLLLIYVVTFVLCTASALIIEAALREPEPCPVPEKVHKGWRPPNVKLCPEDSTLWSCIKDARYKRGDI